MADMKLLNKEVAELLDVEVPQFPKYVTQILNLANQNAQSTRPKVVGQMSELVPNSGSRSYREWEEWYSANYPGLIDEASEKVWTMVSRLKEAINKIDEETVKKWVSDLVLAKTYVGLRFQEAILKKIAAHLNKSYRLATPQEEASGIDGWIGDKAVSIKPDTYRIKKALPENISVSMIYYSKTKDGIHIDFDKDGLR
jgi:hypothetical protein